MDTIGGRVPVPIRTTGLSIAVGLSIAQAGGVKWSRWTATSARSGTKHLAQSAEKLNPYPDSSAGSRRYTPS